jgi:hypothetical protein
MAEGDQELPLAADDRKSGMQEIWRRLSPRNDNLCRGFMSKKLRERSANQRPSCSSRKALYGFPHRRRQEQHDAVEDIGKNVIGVQGDV